MSKKLIPRPIKEFIQYRLLNPVRFKLDTFSKPHVVKLLLISDNEEYTSEEQFAPFYAFRSRLKNKLGLAFNHILYDTSLADLSSYDWIGLKFSFRKSKSEILKAARHINAIKGNARLTYFDGDDDLCILHPELLEIVDLYIKKQVFSNPNDFLCEYTGKSNLTDYVSKMYGVSFKENIIPHATPVEHRWLSKILPGWNVSQDDKIRTLFIQESLRAPPIKYIDVTYRANVPSDDWSKDLRLLPKKKLEKFPEHYAIKIPTMRVSQAEYNDELRNSKICVSPFGYGEVCWRDFEAVICRCLLIKPDVSHIKTSPNIFIPRVTYVPVKWDYSDLEEKCLYYLENPEERTEITEKAYKVLSEYYNSNTFFDQVKEIMEILKLKRAGHGI